MLAVHTNPILMAATYVPIFNEHWGHNEWQSRGRISVEIIQYIPRNMHTVFAMLCFVVVIHWLIFPYQSGLLHWHCGNLTIAPVPAKQPWWIWINTSCEFIMNDCITTTKQSTTKPCAYFLGYTVCTGIFLDEWTFIMHGHYRGCFGIDPFHRVYSDSVPERLLFLSFWHSMCVRKLGAVSIRKTVLPGMAIPMLKIRRPNGRLIFNMEMTVTLRVRVLYQL